MKNRQILRELYAIVKPFGWIIALVLVLSIISHGLWLVGPYIYGQIVDKLIDKRPMAEIWPLLGLTLATYIVSNVALSYLYDWIKMAKLTYQLERSVGIITLEAILRFSIGQHENENSGIKQSVIGRGGEAIMQIIIHAVYNFLPMFLSAVAALAFLFVMAPIIGFVVLSGMIFFIGTTIIINRHFRKEIKKSTNSRHRIRRQLSEILQNVTLVKANAREELTIKEYGESLKSVTDYNISLWTRFFRLTYGRWSLVDITRVGVMAIGAWQVFRGSYTPGFLLMIFSWSWSAFEQIAWFSRVQRDFIEAWANVRKFYSVLAIPPAVTEVEDPVILDPVRGEIELRDVWFKYPVLASVVDDDEDDEKRPATVSTASEPVLRGVNLKIHAGETIAIVGPSGAGKSTLIKMLIRAYDPDRGAIRIDGHDLKELSLKHYREAIGFVPQDVYLFDQTIRFNILLGMNGFAKQVTEEELDEVAELACIDRFRHRLTEGYDTMIGERGIKLSGGERQRVAIARAIIKRPQALIFDEATSNLDTENEALIRESIRRASRGRTTIVIAHRFSTVKVADRIIVMDQGCVVGQGSHDELLAHCDVYRRLIENQTVMIGG